MVAIAVRLLEESFRKKAWHGTNLRGSIRGLTVAQASWRPAPGRHTIADIVVHTAYWKYAVRRRLTGEKRGSFPLKGSNWFRLPDPLSEADWKGYVRLLETEHSAMMAVIAGLSDAALQLKSPGSKLSHATVVFGIAAHDVYHAGQIQTLKALQKSR